MKFISLLAGIGGFDLGFERSGLTCVAQVEIDKQAQSVLRRHYPDVPKFSDVRAVGKDNLPSADVICGGFPCQDLSVAGNRAGFSGERSSLFFEMVRITNELRPSFLIWENVPGLLSSRDGADFWHVLNELDAIGYCGAWTGLDAQWFGVAQRRRRIFGVFARHDIGATRCAEILSIAHRLHGHFETSGAAGQDIVGTLGGGTGSRGWAPDTERMTFIPSTTYAQYESGKPQLRANGGDAGLGSEALVAAIALCNRGHADTMAETLRSGSHGALPMVMAFAQNTRNEVRLLNGDGQLAGALSAEPGMHQQTFVAHTGVRRLTPTECERLQGFPDGWTDGQSDGVRYRQLGNAVAVPVIEWLGRRLTAGVA